MVQILGGTLGSYIMLHLILLAYLSMGIGRTSIGYSRSYRLERLR